MRALAILALGLLGQWASLQAHAGSQAPEGELRFAVEEIASFAKRVEREIARRGATVALVARVGRPRDSLPEGIRFTHVGVAVYSDVIGADGRRLRGYATHNLYQGVDNPDTSFIQQDYLFDFFSDVHLLESAVIIPVPALQKKLRDLIAANGMVEVHRPRYSVLSNPHNAEFQNCVELVLDVVNASVYDTRSTDRLKAVAKQFFEPTPVKLGNAQLALAGMFVPGVRIIDHPGPVATATYGSLVQYMQRHGLADVVFDIPRDR